MGDYETFGFYEKDSSVIKTISICLIFHSLYLCIPTLLICFPIYLIFSSNPIYKAIGGVIVAYYFTTFDGSHLQSGRPWPEFINSYVVRLVLEWLPIQIRRTVDLKSDGLYVFAAHPHGTLAFNRGGVGFSTDTLWNKAFPGVKFRVLTATAAFFVPFIREMWLWSYCIDASKSTASRIMEKEKCSIFVYPGGEKEQMETIYGEHRIFLKTRKGFVRLAIEQGASLVPVYAFGETELYYHYQLAIGLRKWLVNKFSVAVPLISGQFGLMPYRTPVTLVFGEPISLKKNSHPSTFEVDAAHELYINALVKLFNNHKASLGYGDKELVIL